MVKSGTVPAICAFTNIVYTVFIPFIRLLKGQGLLCNSQLVNVVFKYLINMVELKNLPYAVDNITII